MLAVMSARKAPLGTRILGNILKDAQDREAMTDEQVITSGVKANRIASSGAARIIIGLPDRRARVTDTAIDLPGRRLALRVHRPKNGGRPLLPLIVSFHGGGFIAGTAAQNDWLNSFLGAHCPAVVVSVEYRLARAIRCAGRSRTAMTRSSHSWTTPVPGASTPPPSRSWARARAA